MKIRRWIGQQAYRRGMVNRIHRWGLSHAPHVALVYHRVFEHPAELGRIPMGEISTDCLRQQLSWLKRQTDILSADSWMESRAQKHTKGRPRVLITFDDGYDDFVKYAVGICRELEIRPLLFVAPRFMEHLHDHPWWDLLYRAREGTDQELTALRRKAWDREKKIKNGGEEFLLSHRSLNRPPLIDTSSKNEFARWNDLRQLADSIDFGAHGYSHVSLTTLSENEILNEFKLAREVMERQFVRPIKWLAYPYGERDTVNARVIQIAKDAGFLAAFLSEGGFDAHPHLAHTLPRVAFPPQQDWNFACHWVNLGLRERLRRKFR